MTKQKLDKTWILIVRPRSNMNMTIYNLEWKTKTKMNNKIIENNNEKITIKI